MIKKMVFFTSFLLFSINAQNVHAQWVVTNPISDAVNITLSTIQEIEDWARQMWKEFKDEYKWLIDLANDIQALSNQIQMIQNQYEQLEYMYEKASDFDASNFFTFANSLAEFSTKIDDIFDQAEGLTATAGDMQDKMDAMMPRVYGMASMDADHWKDFFAASEKAKHYSVKNNLKGLQEVRKSWKEVKKQLSEMQKNNKTATNEKQIIKVTNEILLREQVQLMEVKTLLAAQSDMIATAAIAAENQKQMVAAETKKVMQLSDPQSSIEGPGLFKFR